MNRFSLWLEKTFGANYKVSLSHIGALFFATLTFLSGISYETVPMAAAIIPPSWKPKIMLVSGISTMILWFFNGIQQKAKNVTGGNVIENADHRFSNAKRVAGTAHTIKP